MLSHGLVPWHIVRENHAIHELKWKEQTLLRNLERNVEAHEDKHTYTYTYIYAYEKRERSLCMWVGGFVCMCVPLCVCDTHMCIHTHIHEHTHSENKPLKIKQQRIFLNHSCHTAPLFPNTAPLPVSVASQLTVPGASVRMVPQTTHTRGKMPTQR